MAHHEDRDRQADGEDIAEAVLHISLCIARALHDIDPQVTRRMNFEAGLSYNRLLKEDNPIAAQMIYAFGRALLDPQRFPPSGGHDGS